MTFTNRGRQMSILQHVQNFALQADLAKKRISSIRDAQGHVNPAIIAPKVPIAFTIVVRTVIAVLDTPARVDVVYGRARLQSVV